MNWIQVLLIGAIVSLLFYLLRSRTSAKTRPGSRWATCCS